MTLKFNFWRSGFLKLQYLPMLFVRLLTTKSSRGHTKTFPDTSKQRLEALLDLSAIAAGKNRKYAWYFGRQRQVTDNANNSHVSEGGWKLRPILRLEVATFLHSFSSLPSLSPLFIAQPFKPDRPSFVQQYRLRELAKMQRWPRRRKGAKFTNTKNFLGAKPCS